LIAADEFVLTEFSSFVEAELLKNKELLKRNFVALSHVVNQFDHFTNLLQFYKNALQEDPALIFKSNDFTTIKQEILINYLDCMKSILKPIEVWDKLMEWAIAQNDSLSTDTTMWNSDDIRIFGDLIQPFIPHINFKGISRIEFSQKIKPFKKIFNHDFYVEILEYYSFDDNVIMKFQMDIDSKIINSEQAFLLANLIKILENPSVYSSISKRVDVFFYRFTLLVRGSRDGFLTTTFHNCCDMKGPTITIARVKGTNEILGGFNPYNWQSKGGECKDDSDRQDNADKNRRSFIFSLDNKNLGNSIYSKVCSGACAHCNEEDLGPNFGGKDADLNLLRTGVNEGKCVKKHYETRIRESTDCFQIDEYEVFQVGGFNFENSQLNHL
jgi:hypothetical protein